MVYPDASCLSPVAVALVFSAQTWIWYGRPLLSLFLVCPDSHILTKTMAEARQPISTLTSVVFPNPLSC